jgi:putative ABC transport system permease protein
MIRSETLRVAVDALRANKVRAFLTMLGVVIGSACIVLVVTVALTGKKYILAQIEGVGANIVYAKYVREGPLTTASATDEINLADVEAIRQQTRAVEVAGTRELPVIVVVEGVERPINIVGITESFQKIRNLVLLRGRFFDAEDMQLRNKVCLLTEELADLVFPAQNPVGKEVRLNELNFTVIGVFRERVSTFGQSEIKSESALIPFPMLRYLTSDVFVRVLYAQAAAPEDVPALTRQVEEVLVSRHRAGAVYRVENLTSLLSAAQNISMILTIVLVIVAFIALLISGVGIMNIMLVTVTQRTREIGIRKAIGAPRREILLQFLIEAGLISGTGALLGIFIAVSIPAAVTLIPSLVPAAREWIPADAQIPISWISVVIAFVVSAMTGILFGLLPANKAAKLQPTESLRYE